MTIDSNSPKFVNVYKGLYSDIKTAPSRITTDQLCKLNNFFEFTEMNKKTRPFLDIDTKKGGLTFDNEEDFKKVDNAILDILKTKFPNYSLLHASHYQAFDGKEKKPKFSYRQTDYSQYCKNMEECKIYSMEVMKEIVSNSLGKYMDYVEMDTSVYRHGKFSCVNSYKFPQQKERFKKLINGTVEDTLIQVLSGNEKYIYLSDSFEEEEEKQPESEPLKKVTKKVKPNKAIKKKTDNSVIDIEPVSEETSQKFWKYASLINKGQFVCRDNWLKFTLAHINILGLGDYDKYDTFCKSIAGYAELENRLKYEELYDKKDRQTYKLGWGYIYKLAYDGNEQEKINLDKIYREPFKIWTMLKQKTKTDDVTPIQDKIDEINDNDELKTSVKNKKIKALEKEFKKQTEDNKNKQYTQMKKYFELYHFKLLKPFYYAKINDDDDVVDLFSKQRLVDLYDNIDIDEKTTFTSKWYKDPNIKSYACMDFIPYGKTCPNSTFNLFTGFRVEKIITNEIHSYEHILEALKLNAGDDEDMYNYMIKYCAHMLQKPAILPEVSLVITGEQGTGKSSFWENFGNKILGERYTLQSSNADDIVGKFNINKNKILVIMEETEGKDTFLANSQIKTLITQETKIFESKGKDKIRLRNCGRNIFVSNRKTPVKIEQSDRRFEVSECSSRHKQDREFFGKVQNEWKDDIAVRNLYDYFMSIDISDFDPARDRVITEAYKDMQSITIPTMSRWLEHKYYNYNQYNSNHPEWSSLMKEKTASELYQSYLKFMEQNGFKTENLNSTSFGRDVKRYKGIEKHRSSRGHYYKLKYEDIINGLIEMGHSEKINDDITSHNVVINDDSDDESSGCDW